MRYHLLGTTKNSVRTHYESTSLKELREFGSQLRYYSIYKQYHNGRMFHNATDENFLVEHKDDPFWSD